MWERYLPYAAEFAGEVLHYAARSWVDARVPREPEPIRTRPNLCYHVAGCLGRATFHGERASGPRDTEARLMLDALTQAAQGCLQPAGRRYLRGMRAEIEELIAGLDAEGPDFPGLGRRAWLLAHRAADRAEEQEEDDGGGRADR